MPRLTPRPAPPGASPALTRLRRLRLSLTLLFTVAMGLGLLVLAVLVSHKDSALRRESLESEMERRVIGSSRLLYYSNAGKLQLDGLRDDDVTTGTPEIRVLAGTGPRPRVAFESESPHLPVPARDLDAIAAEARRLQRLVYSTVTDRRGDDVRLVAGPFYRDSDGKPGGAVVSATALGASQTAHRELVATIAIGCAALLLAAAAAGFVLSGRSLRPAAESLSQQEALLADAAHELRTPIASIRALLESAQMEPGSSASAIESARAVSERMGHTLHALLAWGRLESGTEAPPHSALRLDLLVEEAVATLGPDSGIRVSSTPSVVSGDPELVRIAVRNLLDNALRHGGDGPVEVTARAGAVTVLDRGPGLPDTVWGDGVGRFGSRAPDGTGLGLSIAARIAEAHDGSLSAEPRSGGGSMVRISLPEVDAQGR